MLVLPCLLYYSFPTLYKKSGLELVQIRELPYRDSIEYFFTPDKSRVSGALRYAREVFEVVEPHAIIIADFNPGLALKYYQEVNSIRKDVSILIEIDSIYFFSQAPVKDLVDLLREHINGPLYLADSYEPYYFTTQLNNFFDIRRIGPILKVESFS
jgi:hypothetical protein